MSLGEQWGIGLVSTAHFRPAATGGPYSQLVLIPEEVVAGHCYSTTAIRGQLARDMFQDCVENLEGEILTLS